MSLSTIIDNQDGNRLYEALQNITQDGYEFWIATAFFSLDALNMLGDQLDSMKNVRLIFGGDAAATQRLKLLEAMRELSDRDLVKQREDDPLLKGLAWVRKLIEEGRLEARVYTATKFHAKAYLAHCDGKVSLDGIVGSGNFTRPGLTQNIELNIHLNKDQAPQLKTWFEDIWSKAEADTVTADLLKEIVRHVDLYSPYAIYLRSLVAWGDYVQGRGEIDGSDILGKLDAHQEDAFRQALKVLERENGVMVCDGVGLGKSFVALALMEHFLRNGQRVMLVAPKAILSASWQFYLRTYLQRYQRGFGSLQAKAMTWFGFEPELPHEEIEKLIKKGQTPPALTPALQDLYDDLDEFGEQTEVLIIDESHNFRKTNSQRYINLLRMLEPRLLGRKKVILLTATPLNTQYTDVSAQMRLLTLNDGAIGGLPIEQLQKEAVRSDREAMGKANDHQLSLFQDHSKLQQALSTVAIQRSRATCIKLAEERGKKLRFPERSDPSQLAYDLSPMYREVVDKAQHDFTQLANFIHSYREAVKKASDEKNTDIKKGTLVWPSTGLRLSAYMPDRYRKAPGDSLRDAQVESFLVMLVFTNVIKQLESSPEAFLGILRSLGAGLCARLFHVFGEEVNEVLNEHMPWVQGSVKDLGADAEAFEEEVIILGDDDVEFLDHAVQSRNVRKGLSGFSSETHDTKTWRKHIESDLRQLQDIYKYAQLARLHDRDEKLLDIAKVIKAEREAGRKVLVFTQSVRTSQYLHYELPALLGERVERVDAGVQGDRRERILHEFSPRYNPISQPPLKLEELGVLVTTDVLSEGVNLQEAGCILNYDLHWNPVRLIQRIGRVDRRLRDDDPGHSFSIYNVIPPPEIEKLINLVDTVEMRKRKISRLLGLDQAFFSAEDDAGTLKEFNSILEGRVTIRDEALARYSKAVHLSPEEVALADALPPGGFGVWQGAPSKSVFALFTVTALPEASKAELKRLAPVLGMPVFVLRGLDSDSVITEPTRILEMMSAIEPDEKSGLPSDEEALKSALKKMRRDAFSTLSEVEDKVRLTVKLECWMELRP